MRPLGWLSLAAAIWLTSTAAAQNAPPPPGQLPEFDEEHPETWVTGEVVADASAVRPGDTIRLAVIVRIAQTFHIYGPASTTFIPTEVTIEAPGLVLTGPPAYPPTERLEFFGEAIDAYRGVVVMRAAARAAADLAGGSVSVRVTVRYQGCTDQVCYPANEAHLAAEIPVAAAGAPVSPANGQWFAEGGSPTEPGPPPETVGPPPPAEALPGEPETEFQRMMREQGLAVVLVWAFFWGFLTSLTPCVYPIIPVTVAYFSAKTEGKLASRVFYAAAYAGGIAATFAALGVVFGLLGRQAGSLQSSPWFVAVIAAILLAFAGSMFGWYEIALPSSFTTSLQKGARSKGGAIGAFLLGATLGAVAAPCIGAFAGAILTYIFMAQDPYLGGLVLLVFGLGIGSLFFVLALFSGLIDRLPQSGDWMDAVKGFFAFVLIVQAIWIARVVINARVGPWAVPLAVGVVCVFWGAHTGAFDRLPETPSGGRRLAKALGLFLVLYGATLLVSTWVRHGTLFTEPFVAQDEIALAWRTDDRSLDDPGALARESGKPVLVDFRADWCVPCVRLEREVFSDPAVRRLLAERFVIVRADATASDSRVPALERDRYGEARLPFLALHRVDGTYDRETSRLLSEEAIQESLTPARFVEILSAVR